MTGITPEIKALRILPPLAIGRLGSAEEPLDNYTIAVDSQETLGFRRIVPGETLIVDPVTGEISDSRTAGNITFTSDRQVRPVAPFLEVFAVTREDELVPLTTELLASIGLGEDAIRWRVRVANRKIFRRTQDEKDIIEAVTDWFRHHEEEPLLGRCQNFVEDAAVKFGHARYIKPNLLHPQIRLRFTPANGLIYGADHFEAGDIEGSEQVIPPERMIYDHKRGSWYHFSRKGIPGDDGEYGTFETVPPSLFAIVPPAPSWLYNNRAISRGYFDDSCDGIVEVALDLGGQSLIATARICAGPPMVAPDSLFVRSLADDLEQVINGPRVDPDEPAHVTQARAEDIVRRAFETVRFMNVAVMNGNDINGRSALLLDSMPEEEAADTERAIRPIMAPESVDTLAILTLHQQVYAALRGGAAPWFVKLLRQPDEVSDFTDHGRRKMPALMCGADNSYLALTHRQIATIKKVADRRFDGPASDEPTRSGLASRLTPRNLTAQLFHVAAGNPVASRPETSVANCCPGLELDFRAVWRRIFEGITLREYDNLVMQDERGLGLLHSRLMAIELNGKPASEGADSKHGRSKGKSVVRTTNFILGPASSDTEGAIRLTTSDNPFGAAPLEWSNTLARVLAESQGGTVICRFAVGDHRASIPDPEAENEWQSFEFKVRRFFEPETAVIAEALAAPGELTQGLCSPWQNDYRECSCYYWASARPDFVNVETGSDGLSRGDNWFQKNRTGRYVPDDYADSRLVFYDDLFTQWEKWLRFQIRGRDIPPEGKEPS
jgi:hypothetical protein